MLLSKIVPTAISLDLITIKLVLIGKETVKSLFRIFPVRSIIPSTNFAIKQSFFNNNYGILCDYMHITTAVAFLFAKDYPHIVVYEN